MCRLLTLTCLTPDIVETILDGRQTKGLKLADLLRGVLLAWEKPRGGLVVGREAKDIAQTNRWCMLSAWCGAPGRQPSYLAPPLLRLGPYVALNLPPYRDPPP